MGKTQHWVVRDGDGSEIARFHDPHEAEACRLAHTQGGTSRIGFVWGSYGEYRAARDECTRERALGKLTAEEKSVLGLTSGGKGSS